MQRLALFALALAVATPAAAASWDIDPAHSNCGFTVKHLVFTKVHGRFAKWSGTVNLDEKDITKSTVNVTIDPASIDTNVDDRNKHLQSPDFFDVAKFKDMSFKSTKIEKTADGLKITGDLTMHGVTKPVTLDVSGPSAEYKDMMGKPRMGLSATGKLKRSDWGLTWNKTVEAGPVVSDEVALEIDVELTNKH